MLPALLIAVIIGFLIVIDELRDLTGQLKEIKGSALFRDAEARLQEQRLEQHFEESYANNDSTPYPVESMQGIQQHILPVRPPYGMTELLREIANSLSEMKAKM
jgi:hypothetical protein